jgi:SAM-dependent methyltransferase
MSVDVEPDDWDAHWSEYADAAASNPAQSYRRRLILDLLTDGQTAPSHLLDIGSGTGELIADVLEKWPGTSALGLELSEFGVALAQRQLPAARFRVRDLLTQPEPLEDEAQWATHAVCSEVLEHVDDPVQLLRNARAWLAPGCRLVVTVPGGPMSTFDKHIGHRRHFSPADIGEVLKAAGLEPLRLEAAGFPFHNLYRAMVIAQGRRLVATARSPQGQTGRTSLLVRAGSATFEPLFRLNLPASRFGWQTVAVAREPG